MGMREIHIKISATPKSFPLVKSQQRDARQGRVRFPKSCKGLRQRVASNFDEFNNQNTIEPSVARIQVGDSMRLVDEFWVGAHQNMQIWQEEFRIPLFHFEIPTSTLATSKFFFLTCVYTIARWLLRRRQAYDFSCLVEFERFRGNRSNRLLLAHKCPPQPKHLSHSFEIGITHNGSRGSFTEEFKSRGEKIINFTPESQ
jgi:hypothetical protein